MAMLETSRTSNSPKSTLRKAKKMLIRQPKNQLSLSKSKNPNPKS